jgi:hypothetical protein
MTTRSPLLILLAGFSTAIVLALVILQGAAYADNRLPLNNAEQNAYDLCNDPGSLGGARGAIWFTNSTSYYNDHVSVSSNATSVDVRIRGSVYGCRISSPGRIYAVDVAPAAPNANLLTRLSATQLYRGQLPNPSNNNWSSQGGSISATLNISSVPQNTSTSPVTTTLQVGVYRCFFQNNIRGTCYSETINVYVTRAGVSNSWTSSASTILNYTRTNGATGSGTAIDAYPGDRLRWGHTMAITNFRSGAPSRNMWDAVERTGSWSGTRNADQPRAFSSSTSWSITDPFGTYTVAASDIGKTLCQRLSWHPYSYNDSSTHVTPGACASIRSDYNYEPFTSLLDGSKRNTISVGDPVQTVDAVYRNGSVPQAPTEWAVYEFVVDKNNALPSFAGQFNRVGSHGNYAQVSYADTETACDWLSRTYAQIQLGNCKISLLKNGSNATATETIATDKIIDTALIDTTAMTVGDKICRIVVVRHFDFTSSPSTNTTRRVADPACVLIGRKPLVQVWGNDLRVGSSLSVANNALSGVSSGLSSTIATGVSRTYGSWGEYSVIAPGSILAFSSGSGLGSATASAAASTWSRLTFANNTAALGGFGAAAQVGAVPDIKGYFTRTPAPIGITRVTVGDVVLGPSSYVANRVLYSTGTVTINSSINAPSGSITTGANGVGQFVIIANSIRISQSVRNIDAWLIAPGGLIDTCYEQTPPLTTGVCNSDLRITGPIVAKELRLKRTFGTNGVPAETLTMRGDTYIWAQRISSANGTWRTKSVTELPPRY